MDSLPLYRMLERTAELHPDRNAIEHAGSRCTYGELAKISRLVGATIRNETNQSTSVVGIVGRKSPELVQAIWGALETRRGYVVLSPALPAERNGMAVLQCGCDTLVICPGEAKYAMELIAGIATPLRTICFREADQFELALHLPPQHQISTISAEPPNTSQNSLPTGEKIAYVCFTSGSTGKPKGVVIGESSVWAYTKNIQALYGLPEGLKFSLFHELTFDITVHDLYVCFATGGTLCLPRPMDSMAPHRFIQQLDIQAWISVPSVVNIMSGLKALKEDKLPSLRYVFFCGEPLYESQVAAIFLAAKNAHVINLYGPTEATCAITAYECVRGTTLKARNGIVCVGKAYPGQRAWLAGGTQQRGELVLGGSQVALGYCNDPERTAERFATADGERSYNTGDIFEIDDQGDLYFVGRDDQQIKVRGYRVEIHEIEHAVKELAHVDEAVVVPLISPEGDVHELLCFLPASALESLAVLKAALLGKLPEYMVPKHFRGLEDFPRSANGKVDRKQLTAKARE